MLTYTIFGDDVYVLDVVPFLVCTLYNFGEYFPFSSLVNKLKNITIRSSLQLLSSHLILACSLVCGVNRCVFFFIFPGRLVFQPAVVPFVSVYLKRRVGAGAAFTVSPQPLGSGSLFGIFCSVLPSLVAWLL